jgi:tetratricopeptide (TPR) repeat protein
MLQNPEIASLIRDGLELHGQGKFNEAGVIYKRALAIDQNHFDALQLMGTLCGQNNHLENAIAFLDRALKINPNHVASLVNRGNVLMTLKQYERAAESYKHANVIDAHIAENHFNLGVAFQELGRLEDAVAAYTNAIELHSAYPQAYLNRGQALQGLGRRADAVADFQYAIRLRPDHAQAYRAQGHALQGLERLEEALNSFAHALEIDPDCAEAHADLGDVQQRLMRFEQALASYSCAIEIKPDYAHAYSSRGVALQELGHLGEALPSYMRAIELLPQYPQAYNNLGNALLGLKRTEEALDSYGRAIELKPAYAQAYCNRGNAFTELNRLEEALAEFDRALAIDPSLAEAYLGKAFATLLRGDYQQGLPLYEWRWERETTRKKKKIFTQTLWLGVENIQGKTIFLHAEQGLGDSIQFCRYAKLLKELGARVLLEIPKPLTVLLIGLEHVDVLIEKGDPLPAFDYHCPLLSLPLAFKTEVYSIPNAVPYLYSTAARRKVWSERLGLKTKFRVGLAWSGSIINKNGNHRSLALRQLMAYLPANIEYVSLQPQVRESDQDVLEVSEIRHFGQQISDFADTAALCELVDLVLSIDTSVAHLAGAMGKPTWVLLPHAPDWRWLLERTDSPWYPSLKLYRQNAQRRWEPLLEYVADDLQALAKGKLT